MSALEKVLRLSGSSAAVRAQPDLDDELLLSVQAGIRELSVLLAAAPDDDEDDDEDDSNDSGDDDHTGHATYKALMAKKVAPAKASKMCAQADKKVKASALAESLAVILAGQPGREVTLVTLSADSGAPGQIADVRQLHAAAVLALSGKGQYSRQVIQRQARELRVDVSTLPGFGGNSARDEQAAAEMVTLAGKTGAIMPMHHAPMTGKHSHGHPIQAAHDHDHEHFNDNRHDGGPLHRPGSVPRHDTAW